MDPPPDGCGGVPLHLDTPYVRRAPFSRRRQPLMMRLTIANLVEPGGGEIADLGPSPAAEPVPLQGSRHWTGSRYWLATTPILGTSAAILPAPLTSWARTSSRERFLRPRCMSSRRFRSALASLPG